MPIDQTDRLVDAADQVVNALGVSREPGHTRRVLNRLLDQRSLGWARSGGLMVLNANPDGGTVPCTTDVYAHVAGPIPPLADADLVDRTRRALAAVGHPADGPDPAQTLRVLLAGDPGSASSTGGVLVEHTVRHDPRAADVYVHVGGWDQYGQFHLADGTSESPWVHTEDPEDA